ncbi:WD40/YVTN/BNR-like repeat-containing protein [Calditrichota bacterium]
MFKAIFITSIFLLSLPSFSQDYWQQTNKPYSGSFSSIIIDTSGYIYGWRNIDFQRKLFRSFDNGDNWERTGLSLPSNISGYLSAVNDSNQLFFCTYKAILQSKDFGSTWDTVFTGLDTLHIRSLVFGNSGHIFIGTKLYGVFRSQNNGLTWIPVNNGLLFPSQPRFTVDILVKDINGWIYAASDDRGINRSKDNGTNWEYLGLGNKHLKSIAISDDGIIFACCWDNKMYRTNSQHTGWNVINNGLNTSNLHTVVIDKNGYIYVGGYWPGIFRSTNAGTNWSKFNDGILNSQLNTMVVNRRGDVFAAAYSSVYRLSNNEDYWQHISKGLGSAKILSIAGNQYGDVFVGTAHEGIYRSADKGNTWIDLNNGRTKASVNLITIDSFGYIFAETDSGVSISKDNGEKWINSNLGNRIYPRSIEIDNSNGVYLGARTGIYYSEDNGENWVQLIDSVYWDIFKDLTINDSGQVFVSANKWFFPSVPAMSDGAVFKSKDSCKTWQEVLYFPCPGNYCEVDIDDIITNKNNHLFLVRNDYHHENLLRSLDEGQTWNPVVNGLSAYPINTIVCNPENLLFVGSGNHGVFLSTDNGDNWFL